MEQEPKIIGMEDAGKELNKEASSEKPTAAVIKPDNIKPPSKDTLDALEETRTAVIESIEADKLALTPEKNIAKSSQEEIHRKVEDLPTDPKELQKMRDSAAKKLAEENAAIDKQRQAEDKIEELRRSGMLGGQTREGYPAVTKETPTEEKPEKKGFFAKLFGKKAA